MLLSQIEFHFKQLQDQCKVKRDPKAFPEPMRPIQAISKPLAAKSLTKFAKAKAVRAASSANIRLVPAPAPSIDALDLKSHAVEPEIKVPFEVFVAPIVDETPFENTIPVLTPAVSEDKLDSGIFKLEEIKPEPCALFKIFEQYGPKPKVGKMSFKTMGLPVPVELHERMTQFLADHKGKPGSPQSLRDLGLMCLGFAMDGLQAKQEEDSVL